MKVFNKMLLVAVTFFAIGNFSFCPKTNAGDIKNIDSGFCNVEGKANFQFVKAENKLMGELFYQHDKGSKFNIFHKKEKIAVATIKGNGVFVTQFTCDGKKFMTTSDDYGAKLYEIINNTKFELIFDVWKNIPHPPTKVYSIYLFVDNGNLYALYGSSPGFASDGGPKKQYLRPFFWDRNNKAFGYSEGEVVFWDYNNKPWK